MNLPSIIDVSICAQIGVLVLMVIQYVKASIPDKIIPVASILAGIGLSFLFFYKPGVAINFVVVIANGVLGSIMADTGYSFISTGTSPTFTLPSKTQLNGTKVPEGGTK